jgi:hypothetical protein
MKSSKEKIISFSLLEENWSTYGSEKIKEKAILDSLSLLELLDSNLPLPFIVPTANGGIQFEWNYGNDGLEIEWIKPNIFEYYYERNSLEENGILNLKDSLIIKDFINLKLSELT